MEPFNVEDLKRSLLESCKTSSAQSEILYPPTQESPRCGTATSYKWYRASRPTTKRRAMGWRSSLRRPTASRERAVRKKRRPASVGMTGRGEEEIEIRNWKLEKRRGGPMPEASSGCIQRGDCHRSVNRDRRTLESKSMNFGENREIARDPSTHGDARAEVLTGINSLVRGSFQASRCRSGNRKKVS